MKTIFIVVGADGIGTGNGVGEGGGVAARGGRWRTLGGAGGAAIAGADAGPGVFSSAVAVGSATAGSPGSTGTAVASVAGDSVATLASIGLAMAGVAGC